MKTCILGGTGNISTSFIPRLLAHGHEVVLVNRGQSKPSDDYKIPAGVKVLVADRKQRAEFEALMQAQKFDYAIDMIAFDADDARSSLRAFRGVKHFVHCSTVCTYGIQYDWFPADETHPLRPISDYGRNKVAADNVLLAAFHADGFPVTIIKPSSTYGPKMGALRQIAWETQWIDRVRKGKPLAVCGDGLAPHQFLHVEDAAPAFVDVLGRSRCVGQVYNMMRHGFITWADYHRTAMKVLGRDVELVGVPLANLIAAKVPNVGICVDIFAYNLVYSSAKLMRDVPEFSPKVSLEEGLSRVFAALDREGRVPNSDTLEWEDKLIAAQRKVGA
jgi:nucleoside-diphosphate-sugar epimerase